MDWDKLRTFNAAVETGSFSSAALMLNLSQSAVSRQISSLEHDLKTALFHRHARGLKLTEQGEVLHEAAREVIACVSIAEARLTENREHPSGALKISTDLAFGEFWLAPRLKDFHELYPEITLTLLFDGGGADLAMREADVAIRLSSSQRSSVVQRRIFGTHSFAYAAPGYLRTRGTPSQPADLDQHRLVVRDGAGLSAASDDAWLLRLGAEGRSPRQPVAVLDNLAGLYRAVLGGLGIGVLPRFTGPEAAGLVRVLPEWAVPIMDGYFLYPAELRRSKRVTVFRDFLVRKIAESRISAESELPANSSCHRLLVANESG
jgi:DNA-binding transcriptional LysR family regulator